MKVSEHFFHASFVYIYLYYFFDVTISVDFVFHFQILGQKVGCSILSARQFTQKRERRKRKNMGKGRRVLLVFHYIPETSVPFPILTVSALHFSSVCSRKLGFSHTTRKIWTNTETSEKYWTNTNTALVKIDARRRRKAGNNYNTCEIINKPILVPERITWANKLEKYRTRLTSLAKTNVGREVVGI